MDVRVLTYASEGRFANQPIEPILFSSDFAQSNFNDSFHGDQTMLKSILIIFGAIVIFCSPVGPASAQGPVEEALQGCSKELKTFCSSVTPGEGRLVSCIEAHEDQLSSECISALNRAGFWLDTLTRTLTYVGAQCASDALKFCPDVKLGEQRVINCLRENKAKLDKYCGLALQDIGKL